MNLAFFPVILGAVSSVVVAAPYVIHDPSTKKPQHIESHQSKKEEVEKRDTFLSFPEVKARATYHIGVSGAYSLDRLQGMVWEDSNDGLLTDSQGTSRNNDRSLTFGLEYHRRIHPGIGWGVLLERYQPKHIDLSDLHPLNQPTIDVGRAFSSTYHITGALVRSYDLLALGRVYLSPSWPSDPFLQMGVGVAHCRNSFIHPDHQKTVYVSDVLGIWQVGLGTSIDLMNNYSMEVVGGFRNQHEVKFQEVLTDYAQTPNTTYTLNGSISTLFAFDLKLTFKKAW